MKPIIACASDILAFIHSPRAIDGFGQIAWHRVYIPTCSGKRRIPTPRMQVVVTVALTSTPRWLDQRLMARVVPSVATKTGVEEEWVNFLARPPPFFVTQLPRLRYTLESSFLVETRRQGRTTESGPKHSSTPKEMTPCNQSKKPRTVDVHSVAIDTIDLSGLDWNRYRMSFSAEWILPLSKL